MLEHQVHIERGGLTQNGLALGLTGDDRTAVLVHLHAVVPVGQQNFAVAVGDHRIEVGGGVLPIPGEGGIGRRHLQGGHALGETAQCQGRIVQVGTDDAGAGLIILHQGRDAELFRQEVIGVLQPQLVQHLHRDGVQRVGHSGVHIGETGVIPLVVHRPQRAVAVLLEGGVVLGGGGEDETRLHGRCVHAQGLDGGAWGTEGVGGTVPDAVARLFPDAASQRHHSTGAVVHHRDAAAQGLTAQRLVLGRVVGVAVHRVHFGLHLGVQAGVDLQTAGVDEVGGGGLVVAVLLAQVVDDRFNHRVSVPAVVAVVRPAGLGLAVLGAEDALDLFRLGLVPF